MSSASCSFQHRSKRYLYICGVVLLFALLGIRAGHLQLITGEAHRVQADENRFFRLTLPAPRGVFLDRYGEALVRNEKRYALRDTEQITAQRSETLSRKEALPLIATAAAEISVSYDRIYPYQDVLAHVLGYLGPVTVEDLKARSGLEPSSTVGKMGLELVFDRRLQGSAGQRVIEIDALGEQQRVLHEQPPQPGETMETTLDPILSTVAHEALGARTGSVIIGDASTGEILSMVSKPGFDPTVLSNPAEDPAQERQRRNQVANWLQDPAQRFFNRGIAGAYPPGSVFKMITALSGLQHDAMTPERTVVDDGVLEAGEFTFANWYFTQYGRTEGEIGLERAIARSNDIYFYKAAEWTGPATLAETARLFGFGTSTGIELSGEARGLVPDPAWKLDAIGERWYLGNTYHFGIGQGDLTTTPLQLWSMLQAISMNGRQCQPHLLRGGGVQRCGQVGIDEQHFEPVLQGMVQACSSGGTAYPFFQRNATFLANTPSLETATAQRKMDAGMMACKTGTAEFGPENDDGFRDTHAWFGGIVQPQVPATATASATLTASAPDAEGALYARWLQQLQGGAFPDELVIMVLVESDEQKQYREGSQDAAPVAAQIVEWMETGVNVDVQSDADSDTAQASTLSPVSSATVSTDAVLD